MKKEKYTNAGHGLKLVIKCFVLVVKYIHSYIFHQKHKTLNINLYTTLNNFSMKYLMMCKVYTDVGGIKLLYHGLPTCT